MSARRQPDSTASTVLGIAAAMGVTWFVALVVDVAFQVLS